MKACTWAYSQEARLLAPLVDLFPQVTPGPLNSYPFDREQEE